MARNQRFFQDGDNQYNGYTIRVNRFTSAYDNGSNSRIAGKHWGSIITPDGSIVSMGDSGMTTTQIKKMVEKLSNGDVCYSARLYNRAGSNQGESAKVKQLIRAKEALIACGMDVSELDAKIDAARAEAEAIKAESAAASAAEKARIKSIKAEIKKLKAAQSAMAACGCSTAEVDAKIETLEASI